MVTVQRKASHFVSETYEQEAWHGDSCKSDCRWAITFLNNRKVRKRKTFQKELSKIIL